MEKSTYSGHMQCVSICVGVCRLNISLCTVCMKQACNFVILRARSLWPAAGHFFEVIGINAISEKHNFDFYFDLIL